MTNARGLRKKASRLPSDKPFTKLLILLADLVDKGKTNGRDIKSIVGLANVGRWDLVFEHLGSQLSVAELYDRLGIDSCGRAVNVRVFHDSSGAEMIIDETPEAFNQKENINESFPEASVAPENKGEREGVQTAVVTQTQISYENSKATQTVQGSLITPILEQKTTLATFKQQLVKISESAQRVRTLEVELQGEKDQLAIELEVLNKTLEEQERKVKEFFGTIRQELEHTYAACMVKTEKDSIIARQ